MNSEVINKHSLKLELLPVSKCWLNNFLREMCHYQQELLEKLPKSEESIDSHEEENKSVLHSSHKYFITAGPNDF